MSDYVKTTNFAEKDALTTGNPLKVVKGTELDTEFTAIAVAVATKADSSTVTSGLAGKQATITGAATTIASSNLTANRAVASDGDGKVAVSAVTATELGYLSGVTSALQTQLAGKAATSHNHDGTYAAAAHNHSGVYSPVSHNHDGVYAAASHTHSYLPLSGGTISGSVTVTGTVSAGQLTYTSDYRLKHGIRPLEGAEGIVAALQGVRFRWDDNGRGDAGLIAQDVARVLPEAVHKDPDTGFLSVNAAPIIAALIESHKALAARVAALEAR